MINNWVVLLNYNTAELCLRHINRLVHATGIGLCVIDNHSSGDEFEALCRHAQQVGALVLASPLSHDAVQRLRPSLEKGDRIVLLPIPRNLGFGGGNNVGLRLLHHACGTLLQAPIINPDVDLSLQDIEALLSSEAHICGPAVLEGYLGAVRPHEPAIDYSTGFADTPRWRNLATTGPWLHGCCIKLSGTALTHYGYLPEDLFLYDEETFSFERVKRLGGTPQYLPSIVVKHRGSVKIGKPSFHYFYYITRNRLLYFRRIAGPRYGRVWRFMALYTMWIGDSLWSTVRRRNWNGVRGIAVGVLHGLRGIEGPGLRIRRP